MTKKPEYMFPELQGLPEEFRRLAAQKRERRKMAEDCGAMDIALELLHKENTWFEAAQMLEERLNGA